MINYLIDKSISIIILFISIWFWSSRYSKSQNKFFAKREFEYNPKTSFKINFISESILIIVLLSMVSIGDKDAKDALFLGGLLIGKIMSLFTKIIASWKIYKLNFFTILNSLKFVILIEIILFFIFTVVIAASSGFNAKYNLG